MRLAYLEVGGTMEETGSAGRSEVVHSGYLLIGYFLSEPTTVLRAVSGSIFEHQLHVYAPFFYQVKQAAKLCDLQYLGAAAKFATGCNLGSTHLIQSKQIKHRLREQVKR